MDNILQEIVELHKKYKPIIDTIVNMTDTKADDAIVAVFGATAAVAEKKLAGKLDAKELYQICIAGFTAMEETARKIEQEKADEE